MEGYQRQRMMQVLAYSQGIISQSMADTIAEILPEYHRNLNLPGFIAKFPTPNHYAEEWRNLNIQQIEIISIANPPPPPGYIPRPSLSAEEIERRKKECETTKKNEEFWSTIKQMGWFTSIFSTYVLTPTVFGKLKIFLKG